jgi:hypothetical protein
MAGYVAATRIERIVIRRGVSGRPLGAARERVEPPATVAVIELAGTDLGQPFQRRVDDLRIYLGQLTWYLFNAEGWR